MSGSDVKYNSVVRLPKFSNENIGRIIGPSNVACEKNDYLKKLPSLRNSVITPTWRSYKTFKKELDSRITALEKKKETSSSEEEEGISQKIMELRSRSPTKDPKTPYIRLDSDEEGVFATIESESEEMIKFATFHLKKYQENFRPPRKMNVYSLYATLSHDSIGAMIGRGGATRKALVNEAVANMDDETSPEDLKNCEKSIVKFNPFTPKESFEDFDEMVRGSTRHEYVGWPPESSDTLVKVYVTSFASSEAFEDFIECLKDTVHQRVTEISRRDNEFSEKREREIQDVHEALSGDW